MEELKPELSILRCAADELKNSLKFKKLLGVSSSSLPPTSKLTNNCRRFSLSATPSTPALFEATQMGSRSSRSSK